MSANRYFRTCCSKSPIHGFAKSNRARSITIGDLWDQRSETKSSVVYVFCQFSSREQQNLTAILQCMIRQVIEQADEKVLFAMKHLFVDPMNQREPAGLAESFATACELKSTYLLVDGPDEVTGADGLLPYLSSFVKNGCKVMVTSRDLGHIRKAMDFATKMEICSQVEDLEIYIDSRFQKNELPRGAQKLIGKITEKSGNMYELPLINEYSADQILGSYIPSLFWMRSWISPLFAICKRPWKNSRRG